MEPLCEPLTVLVAPRRANAIERHRPGGHEAPFAAIVGQVWLEVRSFSTQLAGEKV